MSRFSPLITPQWQQLRERLRPAPHNRTLWALILVGLLAVAGELALRAWEHQEKLDRELINLRKRVQTLQASADRVDWVKLGDQLATAQHALQEQLWHAPSEAQAQAMLRDWLSTMLKDAAIARPTLRLQPVQAAAPGVAASANGSLDNPPTAGAGARLARQAVRARAQISFELTPGTLETVLQRVEQGGQLASVDALNASKRNRRVEMSISVPVIIEASPSGKSETQPDTR